MGWNWLTTPRRKNIRSVCKTLVHWIISDSNWRSKNYLKSFCWIVVGPTEVLTAWMMILHQAERTLMCFRDSPCMTIINKSKYRIHSMLIWNFIKTHRFMHNQHRQQRCQSMGCFRKILVWQTFLGFTTNTKQVLNLNIFHFCQPWQDPMIDSAYSRVLMPVLIANLGHVDNMLHNHRSCRILVEMH